MEDDNIENEILEDEIVIMKIVNELKGRLNYGRIIKGKLEGGNWICIKNNCTWKDKGYKFEEVNWITEGWDCDNCT